MRHLWSPCAISFLGVRGPQTSTSTSTMPRAKFLPHKDGPRRYRVEIPKSFSSDRIRPASHNQGLRHHQARCRSPQETGATFSLKLETYRRLASACLSVRTDLMTIRKPRDEEPGCVVDLYGDDCMLSVSVASVISLDFYAALDSPEPSRLLTAEDSGEASKIAKHLITAVLGEKG